VKDLNGEQKIKLDQSKLCSFLHFFGDRVTDGRAAILKTLLGCLSMSTFLVTEPVEKDLLVFVCSFLEDF